MYVYDKATRIASNSETGSRLWYSHRVAPHEGASIYKMEMKLTQQSELLPGVVSIEITPTRKRARDLGINLAEGVEAMNGFDDKYGTEFVVTDFDLAWDGLSDREKTAVKEEFIALYNTTKLGSRGINFSPDLLTFRPKQLPERFYESLHRRSEDMTYVR